MRSRMAQAAFGSVVRLVYDRIGCCCTMAPVDLVEGGGGRRRTAERRSPLDNATALVLLPHPTYHSHQSCQR